MYFRYTEDGLLLIMPQDNPHSIIDTMLETGYSEEFCLSDNFDPDFIARLMEAGFLVMSSRIPVSEAEIAMIEAGLFGISTRLVVSQSETGEYFVFVLLPKLHLTRSVLLFENLHIKKTIKRYLDRYELKFNTDFDFIVDRCLAIHGDDWLTPPLLAAIRDIREHKLRGVCPASFALYKNGELVAGEFGIIVGRVYTSYSGYHDEANAGTVQLILTCRYLQERGFAFFDLGMPLDYKTDLGAKNVSPDEFVSLFREANNTREEFHTEITEDTEITEEE